MNYLCTMKFRLFSAFIVLMIAISACSNELDLVSDWKDVPVVYSLLDASDTAQYIRVEKAFLDPNTSALVLAQISDSLYYENITVNLIDPLGEALPFDLIDANLDGFQREEGIFANSPNYLFKRKTDDINFVNGGLYKLEVQREDNLPTVTAETHVLEPIEIKVPNTQLTIRLQHESTFKVKWTSGEEAKIFDVYLHFKYEESEPGNPNNLIDKTLTWRMGSNIEDDEVSVDGEEFYQFIMSSLDPLENGIRIASSIEIQVDGAGEELQTYLTILEANSGITSSQELPVYTNLSEGRGLFSSRYTALEIDYVIGANTRDSLVTGIYTKDLGFQ